MYIYNSIPHITNALNLGKDLSEVLLEKGKSLPFRYDYTLDVTDEDKLNILIEREVIRKNGSYIEMDEHYFSFYELLLEANEEVFTSMIDRNTQLVHQLIDYYGEEDDDLCKPGYLRSAKAHLWRIGKILVCNMVSSQRVIDSTLKNESNYKVKIAKLENLDTKRVKINRSTVEMEKLLNQERTLLFARIPGEELLMITRELKTELLSAGHSLVHSQQDIIDYLNQVRTQVGFTRKLRHIKYLREQFRLRESTNVRGAVDAECSVVLEGVQPTLFEIPIPYLQTDEALGTILKVTDSIRPDKVIHRQELDVISAEQMENQEAGEATISTRRMMNVFNRTGGDLFFFVIGYEYNRRMSFEAGAMLLCCLLSPYENELETADRFGYTEHIEYAIIQRAQLQRRDVSLVMRRDTPRFYNWMRQNNNNKGDR